MRGVIQTLNLSVSDSLPSSGPTSPVGTRVVGREERRKSGESREGGKGGKGGSEEGRESERKGLRGRRERRGV